MPTTTQRGLTTPTLILSIAFAALASAVLTYLWITRQPISEKLPVESNRTTHVQLPLTASSTNQALPAEQSAPRKTIEVAFSKDDKLALSNTGRDGGKILGWRDSVDEGICDQINRFVVRELAADLTTKQLVLRPETTKSLLSLLEICQPGVASYRSPQTVYLSEDEKKSIASGAFSEGIKSLAQQGGLGLSACVLLSRRDIDNLSEVIKLGQLSLGERSRQQLPDLLEECRK